MKSQAQLLEQEQDIPFGDPDPAAPLPASQYGLVNREPERTQEISTIQDRNPYVQMIAAAAAKDVDVVKLEKLMDLQDRWEEKTAKTLFNTAMAKVQSRIQPILADADNDHTGSKYAKLAAIVSTLAPIYTADGFSVSFGTGECENPRLIEAGWFRTTSELSHSGGFSKHYHVDLPPDTTGPSGKVNKTQIHGAKSAISYARVILMGMMFNFTTTLDVDNDGNGAGYQPELITDHEIVFINEAIEAGVVDKTGLLAFAKVKDFAHIEQRNWSTIHSLIQRKYKIAERANG